LQWDLIILISKYELL
jgi:hypothetical protein